ncbi:MAG TPA: UbiA family prenyltransferase, partial [Chloroflexia bacterium]|nr:UbiA family prenyltransferase [Chloroflexia bacterium]
MDQPLRNPPSPVAGTKPSARSGILPWLQLLHFGPSVFTTAAFGMYIALGAHGAVPTGRWALLLGAQLATQFAISLFNDYWDLPADRVTRPDKPIPAGVVSAVRVRTLGVVAAALAVALAAPLGTRVLVCNVA